MPLRRATETQFSFVPNPAKRSRTLTESVSSPLPGSRTGRKFASGFAGCKTAEHYLKLAMDPHYLLTSRFKKVVTNFVKV